MWYRTLAAGTIAALFAVVAPVHGAVVTFEMNIEFSGATPPAGATPWIRASFDDGGGSGSVTLKMESVNLVDTEFVRFWMFNLDTALDPTNLTFSAPVKTGTFDDPTISLGVNAFQADGDGLFDIQFQFSNAPPATRFGVGDAVEYTITGIPTLTANSFNFFSAPAGGGSGPFPTAAHVQGIGSNGANSGWVTQIPEPASMGLLALIGVAAIRRRAA